MRQEERPIGRHRSRPVSERSSIKHQTIDLFNSSLDKQLLELIPRSFAKQYSVFPIKRKRNRLVVAMSNPGDYAALNELRLITGLLIEPVKANEADIQQLIVRDYPSEINMEGLLESDLPEKESAAFSETGNDDSPIIKLVNTLIHDAIDRRASDIHFDPQEKYLAVRIRTDGEMKELKILPKNIQSAVTSRLKIISSLDITEIRVPQDGRAMLKDGHKIIDLRVSVLPTIHGEKVVIRILDRSVGIRKLEDFKFNTQMLIEFRNLLKQPHGIILVTGPTGSGKSSTLYAALGELNKPNVNIITVEDPVEYQLEGINQVAVNSSIGLSFASGLRSILRQDPNVVMVGEIRDGETAEIAIRASMTGHLVLSTLHTNGSVSTINRLVDMGVDTFLVANSLAGVLAQRLVRTICSGCKIEETASAAEAAFLEENQLHARRLAKGKGCAKCGYTGYQGRMAVQELLTVTPELRRMITRQATNDELQQYVRQQGMKFLIDDGLEKVLAGYTTIEEVLKVAAQE
ncbi:GspE/PulE family protein [Enterococcus sp. BWT-B8]|uniref:GspE/PulE family protein n=1 Tax=unclassified Enterococcus TaxID=2608891 RepID=UPI001E3D39BA|nr:MULTISPECIES: GspE/PulE family protein [unclassified Enterococcus]MCB5952534.1 GspE/PulE family protein [Enterococcus sp. BWT-B8]MCB5953424.1 GspE/PulE family protein [Enterococcus sp. CWB-B31]